MLCLLSLTETLKVSISQMKKAYCCVSCGCDLPTTNHSFPVYTFFKPFSGYRSFPGAVLHHAGGGRNPAFLHGASAGTVQPKGGHYLLGASGSTLQR